ncbi:MAG: hypothetical protein LBT51_01490 [Fusobacteriaceae bacterium]|jgi:uncharacterized membrane protein YczE|nr:hypothetical protein [Fusobacteriaceae bacterium]
MSSSDKNSKTVRYIKLMIGIFLCGLGVTMVINSNAGASSWDIFHMGLTGILKMPIGKASIVAGFVVIILNIVLGQTIGPGTILNIYFIGTITDIIRNLNIIPVSNNIFFKIIILLLGMIIYSYGTFLYMSQGKGCGPRDGLMQVLSKKTNISVAIVKNSIEIIVLIMGIFLGGKSLIGIGTLIYALSIGFIISFMFKIHKVEVKTIEHTSLKEEFHEIVHFFTNKK